MEGASAAAFLAAAGCSDGAGENTKSKKDGDGMEFSELIEVRRSVRRYAKSVISKDEMEKIVADALNAPSWKNSETTRYYAAIGDEAKARIWKEALPTFNAANSADAAALVAVTFVPGESGFMGSDPRHSRRRDPHVRHRRWQGRGKAHQGSAQARRRRAEDRLNLRQMRSVERR